MKIVKKMTSLPLQEVGGLLFLYRGQGGGPGTWRRRARSRWPSRFGWCWHYTPPVCPVFRRRPIVPDSEAPRISAVLPHSIFVIAPADRRSSMNLSHGDLLLSLGWFYYSTSASGCQDFFLFFFLFSGTPGRGLILFPEQSLKLFPLGVVELPIVMGHILFSPFL